MPFVRVKGRSALCVLTSDWHITLDPPVARSCEKDWLAVQGRYLSQLESIQEEHRRKIPIVIAGDLYDKYNPSVALINWAIKYVPYCYAIPGQHDLPNHRLADIDKSAFSTLVYADTIFSLKYKESVGFDEFTIHPFPWGCPLVPNEHHSRGKKDRIHLAVIHHYIWQDGHSHPMAKPEDNVREWEKRLIEYGYDAAVFGDNHRHFLYKGSIDILNCGTFLRRKMDERDYIPQVGILWSDGKITTQPLDVSEDQFLDVDDVASKIKGQVEMGEFLEELKRYDDVGLDFVDALKSYLRGTEVSPTVRQLIMKALEK